MTGNLTPADRMILGAVRCVRCGARYGECDCRRQCSCGWTPAKGEDCNNPVHKREQYAAEIAESVAGILVGRMKQAYPEPMKWASGGFRKTLKGYCADEVRRVVFAILDAEEKPTP